MSYELSFTAPDDYEAAVRTVLGVDEAELTDTEITSIAIAGAAEMALLEMVPNIAAILAAEDVSRKVTINAALAFIHLSAMFALPGLKVKLLQAEGDDRSTAQRFKDALNRPASDFLTLAKKYMKDTGMYTEAPAVSQFEGFSPTTNVVTGS